jgi:radical SAM superfamily enzyme YgiQ (UPF0313 family)
MDATRHPLRIALIEAGSPGLNIYSHVAMGRGVSLLATVVQEAGYECRAFIEDIAGKDSLDLEYVRTADVVGFSAITCTLPRTRELLDQVRAINPSAVIVFGGPEPTCDPERSLALGADFVLRGEGELTFPRFLEAVRGHSAERPEDVPGVVWLEGGVLRFGPDSGQLASDQLDELPLVDRSLVHDAERSSVASVWRTRGCPQRCDFCEVTEIWPRFASRGVEKSVSELMGVQAEGHTSAFLIDDNASADKKAFKEFLREVADRGYARLLTLQLRADSVFTREGRLDRELLRLLRRAASVTLVCVGVESADDGNLERLHKGTDSARTARALRAMRRYGLLVHGMMIAFKEDTGEIIRRNGEFARRHLSSLQYLFEVPLPGTRRTRQHEEARALLFEDVDDLALYDGMHVVVKPDVVTPLQMQELVTEEYRRFYSIRRIVAAALKGAFARHRLPSRAQRAWFKGLGFRRRAGSWLRFQIEYRFGQVAFLTVGRRRIREFMRDAEYARYGARLRSM